MAISKIGSNATGFGSDLTITDGDLLFATAAKGVCLGVTSNTDSNTLDDYEEGLATMAFSPGAGSITIHSSYEKLAYTKIGRMVQLNGQIGASAISSLGTSNTLQITGLPFAAVNLDDNAGRVGFHIAHDAAGTMTDGREMFGYINEGGSVINIYENNASGASNKAELMASNSSLYMSFTYTTAS